MIAAVFNFCLKSFLFKAIVRLKEQKIAKYTKICILLILEFDL